MAPTFTTVYQHAHQILVFATLNLQTLVVLVDRQAVAVAGERMYEKDVVLLESLITLARGMEEHAEAIEQICAEETSERVDRAERKRIRRSDLSRRVARPRPKAA